MSQERIDALRKAGISASECAESFSALAAAARLVPMPSMREIARLRLGMLFDRYGQLCLLNLSFWRWSWELLRPNYN